MYTYYFQAVNTLAGQRFFMTAAKSHASGAQPSKDGSIYRKLYQEENLRNLVANGYRVVIDPTPASQKRLNRNFSVDEAREPARLELAYGYQAVYPPTMFAIPRTEFQADQQDSDSIIGRDHYFSNRARCGEDIPPDDGIEVYRQSLDGGKWESVQVPSAGPLPPQAPLAPTEKVDEYGVPEIGSYEEYFSTKTLTPPEGSMLLPSTYQGVSGIQNEQNASEEKPQGFWAWLSEIFGFDNTDES